MIWLALSECHLTEGLVIRRFYRLTYVMPKNSYETFGLRLTERMISR